MILPSMISASDDSATMSVIKQLKLEQKGLARMQHVITELNSVVNSIERCEKTITGLKQDLEAVNAKHQGPRTTPDEIAYLSALLDCAKRKLTWEKQIASLQKRAPAILQQMSEVLNDPSTPPAAQTRAEMLQALERVQAALQRLEAIKMV